MMENVEEAAERELQRVEEFEALLADAEEVSDSIILTALQDNSEPLRAEALDYLSDVDPSPTLIVEVTNLAKRENSVQCVARIAYLSHVWAEENIRESISYRPTIDEAEYILSWDYAGRVRSGDSRESLLKLCVQAASDDWELSVLSQNLLRSVVKNDLLVEGMVRDIGQIATQAGPSAD